MAGKENRFVSRVAVVYQKYVSCVPFDGAFHKNEVSEWGTFPCHAARKLCMDTHPSIPEDVGTSPVSRRRDRKDSLEGAES